MCRGTELDFHDNGRAGEKDVTDSNQVTELTANTPTIFDALPSSLRHVCSYGKQQQ